MGRGPILIFLFSFEFEFDFNKLTLFRFTIFGFFVVFGIWLFLFLILLPGIEFVFIDIIFILFGLIFDDELSKDEFDFDVLLLFVEQLFTAW